MTAKEKREALNAVRKLERQLGAERFGWAVRKYMTVVALKRKTERQVKEMRRALARLERKIA